MAFSESITVNAFNPREKDSPRSRIERMLDTAGSFAGGGIPGLSQLIDLFGGGGGSGNIQPPLGAGGPSAQQSPAPEQGGNNVNDIMDILRNLDLSAYQGGSPGFPGGATPGSIASGGGLVTNVGGADFGRFVPGYGQGAPFDFSSLFGLAGQDPISRFQPPPGGPGGGGGGVRLGGRPGGGGGGGGVQSQQGPAQGLLNNYFSGPAPSFDPGLMGQIQGIMGNSQDMYGGFADQIGGSADPVMQLILGALGPPGAGGGFGGGFGGGGGFSFGGGGGAGGGLSNPDISLKAISPEAQALIDQMTDSRRGELGLARQEASGRSLSDLFGRGIPRSTMAMDQQGRLQYGHEQALQQALAAGAEQTLGAMLADQQARTSLGQSRLGAEAQLGAANASAGASAYGASMGAQSDAYRSQLGLLGSLFGDRSSALASAFGATQGANSGFAGLMGDIGLGQLGALSSRANTALGAVESQNQLNASRYASDAGVRSSQIGANAQLGSARIGQQTALANLPFENSLATSRFQQDEYARMQEGIFRLLGLDQDRYAVDRGYAGQVDSARLGRPREPSTMDRILSILGIAGSAYGAYRGSR
jgi:hypothetical protein